MKQKGFSLIELLVVVAIIGILAAVGVVAYNGYTNAAKKAVVISNVKQVEEFIISGRTMCTIPGGSWFLTHDSGNKADICIIIKKNPISASTIAHTVHEHLAFVEKWKNPYVGDNHRRSFTLDNECGFGWEGCIKIISQNDITVIVRAWYIDSDGKKVEINKYIDAAIPYHK